MQMVINFLIKNFGSRKENNEPFHLKFNTVSRPSTYLRNYVYEYNFSLKKVPTPDHILVHMEENNMRGWLKSGSAFNVNYLLQWILIIFYSILVSWSTNP